MEKDDLKVLFTRTMSWLNISFLLYWLFAVTAWNIDINEWGAVTRLSYLGIVLILMRIIVDKRDYGKQP